jgi:hypothetical protein
MRAKDKTCAHTPSIKPHITALKRRGLAITPPHGLTALENLANVELLPVINTQYQSTYAKATADILGTGNIGNWQHFHISRFRQPP